MTTTVTIKGIDDLKSRIGQELGLSDWHEVTQEAVNTFADATGDHQFIHVDPEKAKGTPFGGTIAHGYFTLSLGPMFSYDLFKMEGVAFALNYGLNKVRFPSPVPVGSRVRMRMQLQNVEDIPGGAQITMLHTFEVEGTEKPGCVAEALSRVYTG